MEPQKPIPPPLSSYSYNSPYVPPPQSVDTTQKIEFAQSVLERAMQNDKEALELMFRQFIDGNEQVHFSEYMGEMGIIIGVTHSFACITDRRMSSLQVGHFGEVLYQDAMLEDVNSGAIYQPSNLWLYVIGVFWLIASLSAALSNPLALLMLGFWPIVVKTYYRIVKCGLLGNVKEGLWVYIFVNRSRLVRANTMWRLCAELRDKRLASLRRYATYPG